MPFHLDDLALFARIAALGSLSAAARERDIPVSQVTRSLTRLETACGARLMHRTTHGLSLTDEGDAFLVQARRMLDIGARGARMAVRDVLGHRGMEEHRILEDHGNLAPQRCQRVLADVMIVDRNSAGRRVVGQAAGGAGIDGDHDGHGRESLRSRSPRVREPPRPRAGRAAPTPASRGPACPHPDGSAEVTDNGRGIPMELDGKLDRGHVMSSMKHRAKQLQGQCLIESAPGYGTVIRLTIPL